MALSKTIGFHDLHLHVSIWFFYIVVERRALRIFLYKKWNTFSFPPFSKFLYNLSGLYYS